MELKYKNGNEVSHSIGLLISILVRYPQVGSINYDPQSKVIKFTFMLSKPGVNLDQFKEKLLISLETFNFLKGKKPKVVNLKFTDSNHVSLLEVHRDVATLSQDEISLIIALVEEQYGEILVSDENEELLDEDLVVQEELISHMLENVRGAFPDKRLIAFREEGKVLVFNK